MKYIRIDVEGIPAPGGSKSGFIVKGRVVMAPASKKTKPWMDLVSLHARRQYDGPLLKGAIECRYTFWMPRPKHHFIGGKPEKGLKPNAPHWHTNTPDLTKIIRSTEDALTGIVWEDDCKVATRQDNKFYCRPGQAPGVEILILDLES